MRLQALLLVGMAAWIAIERSTENYSNADLAVQWAVVIVGGLIIPLMIWTLRLRIRVDERRIKVGLWPVPIRSVVDLTQIQSVEECEVDPQRRYGGWGTRGARDDILYTVGHTHAVTITYITDDTEMRRLTVTTPNPDVLRNALETRLANPTVMFQL